MHPTSPTPSHWGLWTLGSLELGWGGSGDWTWTFHADMWAGHNSTRCCCSWRSVSARLKQLWWQLGVSWGSDGAYLNAGLGELMLFLFAPHQILPIQWTGNIFTVYFWGKKKMRPKDAHLSLSKSFSICVTYNSKNLRTSQSTQDSVTKLKMAHLLECSTMNKNSCEICYK